MNDYIEPMPEGYEPSLSGSVKVHRVPSHNDNGPTYRAKIGDVIFITDDVYSSLQRGAFILGHPDMSSTEIMDHESFLGFSARTPKEAHRAYMLNHLKHITQSEGIYL